MKTIKLKKLHFSLITAVAIACPASAATYIYNGADGNWDTDANWGGTEPVSGDRARIINGETVTVDQGGEIAGRLDVQNGSTLIADSGGALTLDGVSQTAGFLVSSGTINVTGGSILVTSLTNDFIQNGSSINISSGSFTRTQGNTRIGDGGGTATLNVSGTGTWSGGLFTTNTTAGADTIFNLTGSSASIDSLSNFFTGVADTTFNLTPGSTGIDVIDSTGQLNLGGTGTETLNFYLADFSGIQSVEIFSYGSILTGTFDAVNIIDPFFGNLTLGSDPGGDASNLNPGEYWIDYGSGSSDSITLLYAIPEPSSTALLGLGALAFALRRSRA